MKIKLFLLAAGLLTSVGVYAQSNAKNSPFSIIPQAGFNVSHLTTDSESGGRIGFQFGASARIGQRFYVQPGFYWLRQIPQLYQETDEITEEDIEDDISISGFQLVGLVGYKLIDTRIFKFRAQAGPSVSWVSQVRDNEFGLEKNDFASSIWGGKAGLGVDVFFLTLDVNYEFGFSKVFTTISDARNNVLSVTLGARLDF